MGRANAMAIVTTARTPRGRFNGCLRVGWKGRNCPHWVTLGATSWEDLKRLQQQERNLERVETHS